MEGLQRRVRSWKGKDCAVEVPPVMQEGEKEVVMVYQDVCIWHSNDDYVKQWYEDGNPPMKKKTQVHCYCCSCC